MKATEFMLQLAKQLMEERKIAESTATQYLQTLWKLNGSKGFNNLSWTRKFDDVQKIIDTYATSTQSNQYMVLSSALSPFSTKATYKKAYNHWRDKMMESKKERDGEPIHEKSEKQSESWLTWDDVTSKKNALKEEVDSFKDHKILTAPQFDKLMHFVILSLYTDIQPRRNQDYLNMYVVRRWTPEMETSKNYYDIQTRKFIFNKYKTAKTYGQQTIELPKELQDTLAIYLKHHPLAKGKVKEYKLLVKHDGSSLNTVNSITRCLNRIFGKKAGSSMLRHAYLSSKYGDTTKEMEEDAEKMGHSTEVQKGYIKYE